jgi:hypothetical protein
MNIFVLSDNPVRAAEYHVDKHVVKMPTESGQMLSTALQLHGQIGIWKPCHQKHPCTLWAAKNRANFDFLIELGYALCEEYTLRYSKTHGSLKAIDFAAKNRNKIPRGRITPFALAMPEELKIQGNAIESYRNYYRVAKSHIAQWKTTIPNWYYQENLSFTNF